jgi:hypothetical protein
MDSSRHGRPRPRPLYLQIELNLDCGAQSNRDTVLGCEELHGVARVAVVIVGRAVWRDIFMISPHSASRPRVPLRLFQCRVEFFTLLLR